MNQIDWRFCHKCQGLFFAGNPSQGVCPADRQPHDASQSGKYMLGFGESTPGHLPEGEQLFGSSARQGDWRFCHKCQGLFFAGNPSQGVCPAVSIIYNHRPHDASQSGHYAIWSDEGYNNGQKGWRFCHKCQGLFFADNQSQGVCPADHEPHDASQSGEYQLEFQSEPSPPLR